MKKYKVVVHYEGGWFFEVDAADEDEARKIAEEQFNELSAEELIDNLADVFIDASWEIKE